jgi:uncharacterized membrane protein YeaQ/YmgE (transglycosylase-associated protein family)
LTLTGLIIFLVIGAVAGWIAGQIMRGGGFGLFGNFVGGVIGALIGGWLFGLLGIAVRRTDRIDYRGSRWCDHPPSASPADQTRLTALSDWPSGSEHFRQWDHACGRIHCRRARLRPEVH